jgi:predicted neutral ceramidase superfamily lipid hydrolase
VVHRWQYQRAMMVVLVVMVQVAVLVVLVGLMLQPTSVPLGLLLVAVVAVVQKLMNLAVLVRQDEWCSRILLLAVAVAAPQGISFPF